jgi:hypothetical protein
MTAKEELAALKREVEELKAKLSPLIKCTKPPSGECRSQCRPQQSAIWQCSTTGS